MNLERYVQRIESFLSATETEPETWARLSRIMHLETVLVTIDSPFGNCSTKEGFCEACTTTARKMCGSAAFFYESRFKDCMRECDKHSASLTIDDPEDKAQMKRTIQELKSLVKQTMGQFANKTIITAYNTENAFHLFYYADMIRKESNLRTCQTIANDLCEKQQAYTKMRATLKPDATADHEFEAEQAGEKTGTLLHDDVSECISGHTDILKPFPTFNASFSALDDNSLLKSFLRCGVTLQWKTITNPACADRALCAIQEKSASILDPPPKKNLTLSQMPRPPHFVNAGMDVKGKKVACKIAVGGAKIVGFTVLGIVYLICKALEKTTKFGLGFFIDIDDDDGGPKRISQGHYGGTKCEFIPPRII
jgi:hypothetical protein